MSEPIGTRPFLWAPGMVLGDRYELAERIGAGGAAEVWRAVDRRLRRDVAVKLLSGRAATDPTHRQRIEREARALAALAHRNVVQVFDYAEETSGGTEPVPYLVMEHVEGPDLAEHLAASGALKPGEAVPLVAQILRGVAQAHSIGIIHGDLKPGNVLLAGGPGGWEPKVGDFGVARVLAEETGTTVPVATPAYAPPEVLSGERPGPSSDVYSAGCIAYEVLTGERPFRGRTLWEATRQHMETPAPSVLELRPDTPPGIDEAIRRALSKLPSGRYQSAEAFAIALEAALLAGEPAPAVGLEATAPQPPETVPVAREPTVALPPRPARRRGTMPRLRGVAPGPVIAVAGILLLLAVRGSPTASAPAPNLVGRDIRQATDIAKRNGFALRRVDVDSGGKAGTVIEQDPSAGTIRSRGSSITARVTTGAPQVPVPDVTGKSLEEATAIMRAVKFTIAQAIVLDAPQPPNTVIRTIPPGGTLVDEGSTVMLVLAPPAREEDERRGGKGKGRKGDD